MNFNLEDFRKKKKYENQNNKNPQSAKQHFHKANFVTKKSETACQNLFACQLCCYVTYKYAISILAPHPTTLI